MQSQNRFCRYPSTGCSGAAPSPVVDANGPSSGFGGRGGRGALGEPRAPRGRRLPLSPPPSAARCRPALRFAPAPAEAARRAAPFIPGGAAPSRRPRPRKEVREVGGGLGVMHGKGVPTSGLGGSRAKRRGHCRPFVPPSPACTRAHRLCVGIASAPLRVPSLADPFPCHCVQRAPPGLWQLRRCVFERLRLPP